MADREDLFVGSNPTGQILPVNHLPRRLFIQEGQQDVPGLRRVQAESRAWKLRKSYRGCGDACPNHITAGKSSRTDHGHRWGAELVESAKQSPRSRDSFV